MLDNYSYSKGQDDDASEQVISWGKFNHLPPFGNWESTLSDRGYEPFPVAFASEVNTDIRPDSIMPGDLREDMYIYLSCSSLGAIRVVPFCVLITVGEVRYCTNSKKWDAEGKETGTNFGYKVNLQPEAAPRLSEDGIRATLNGEPVEDGFYNIDYVLDVFYPGRSDRIAQRHMTMDPDGMIQWDYPDPDRYKASFTGYAPPGASAYVFNTKNPTGSSDKPLPIVRSDQGVIVLCGRNDIPFAPGTDNGPCALSLTDVYGNEHRASVTFSGQTEEGRHHLNLKVL